MNARLDGFSRWLVAHASRRASSGDGPAFAPLAVAPFDFDALAQGLAEGMPRREGCDPRSGQRGGSR